MFDFAQFGLDVVFDLNQDRYRLELGSAKISLAYPTNIFVPLKSLKLLIDFKITKNLTSLLFITFSETGFVLRYFYCIS